MRTVAVDLGSPPSVVILGKQGENEALTVTFDLSAWVRAYGNGSVEVLLQRPGDDAPYLCETTMEGGILSWPITSTETACAGNGQAQLIYRVVGVIVKTVVLTVRITPSLGAETDPPDPWQGWVDQVIEAKDDAQAAAVEAAQSADSAAQSADSAAQSALEAQSPAASITGALPVFVLEDYAGVDSCRIPADGYNFITNPDNIGKPFLLQWTDWNNQEAYCLCETLRCYTSATSGNVEADLQMVRSDGIVQAQVWALDETFIIAQPGEYRGCIAIYNLSEKYVKSDPNSAGFDGAILVYSSGEAPGGYWEDFAALAARYDFDNKALAEMHSDDETVNAGVIQLIDGARQLADANGTGAVYAANPSMVETIFMIIHYGRSAFINSSRYPVLGFGNYIIPLNSIVGNDSLHATASGHFDVFDGDTGAFYSYTLSITGSIVAVKCVKTEAMNVGS